MKQIKIGDWLFDDYEYDRDSDVLYLSIGQPKAGYGEPSPDGHIWRFDEDGNFCGVTLLDVQALLDHAEDLRITLPSPPRERAVSKRSLNRLVAAGH